MQRTEGEGTFAIDGGPQIRVRWSRISTQEMIDVYPPFEGEPQRLPGLWTHEIRLEAANDPDQHLLDGATGTLDFGESMVVRGKVFRSGGFLKVKADR